MSYWTHIAAAIDVDTYIEDNDIKTVVEGILANAPKITGSEGDADIFVNVLSGHNRWTNKDCDHCKYKGTITYKPNNVFVCGSDDGYECPEGEYQTRVVITVIGDLRDRMKAETHKEWKEFQRFVARKSGCGFEVRNCTCRIQGW